VRRKPFLSLQPKDLSAIRDQDLRRRLEDATHGLSGKEFTNVLLRFRERHDHPFRRVRRLRMVEGLSVIPIRDASGRAYKGYKGDANFRYDVWEIPDGKWLSDVVTMFDAHRSDTDWTARRPHPAARKVLSLKQNDMVAYEDPRGGTTVGIVVKFGQNGQITLVPHNEAGDLKRRDALPNSEEEAMARAAEPAPDGRVEFDPFKYYAPTAGGLKKIGLRQVRVDEMGRVIDPGPRSGRTK
jgi:CRISPR-associated endonuclease Csn1